MGAASASRGFGNSRRFSGTLPLSASPARFSAGRPGGYGVAMASGGRAIGSSGRGSRPGDPGGNSFRRPYGSSYRARGSYLYPGFGGWLGPGLLGYPGDLGPYDDGTYGASAPPGDYQAQPVGPDVPLQSDTAQNYPVQNDGAQQDQPRIPYQRGPALHPAPEPANEEAVTLVFRDGRAPEQIHNYLLTRTTLYVQDARRREIPLNQLDLVATQRVNQDAGVDFRVPEEAR